MGLLHHPAGEDGDQQPAQRQHDAGGQELDIVEEGADQEFMLLPDVEGKHRTDAQQPGRQTHRQRRRAAPQTALHQPGGHRLAQGNRGAPGRAHHQHEEQGAEQQPAGHLPERQRQGHEHHARPLADFQTAGEQQREHGQAGAQRHQGVQHGDGDHRGDNGHRPRTAALVLDLAGHVSAVGHDRAHPQAQGEKRLAQRHDHRLAGQLGEIEREQETHAFGETRRGGGIADQHHQQREQHRHQHAHGALQALLHAQRHHAHGDHHEQGV